MQEITSVETQKILARRSVTLPNFLESNIYSPINDSRVVVSNQRFTVWVSTETLNLQILQAKLRKQNQISSTNSNIHSNINNKQSTLPTKIVRCEFRFTATSSISAESPIDFIEKYKSFTSINGCLNNDSVKQLDLTDSFMACITTQGRLCVADLSEPKQPSHLHFITSESQESSTTSSTSTSYSASSSSVASTAANFLFTTLLMSPSERTTFYALSASNLKMMNAPEYSIHQICCNTKRILQTIRVSNYAKRIGYHVPSDFIRIIRLDATTYLLYSEQQFIFELQVELTTRLKEKITIHNFVGGGIATAADVIESEIDSNSHDSLKVQEGKIVKSYFMDKLSLKMIISRIEDELKLLMLSNISTKKHYVLPIYSIKSTLRKASHFNRNNEITSDSNNVKFNRQQGIEPNNAQQSSIENFVLGFQSKRELYLSLKNVWSLSLAKAFESFEKEFVTYFSEFALEKVVTYLEIHSTLSLLQLIKVTTAVLMQVKLSKMMAFVNVVTRLLQLQYQKDDHPFKNKKETLVNAIWESMPLFDRKKEKDHPEYRKVYQNIADVLEKRELVHFLFK